MKKLLIATLLALTPFCAFADENLFGKEDHWEPAGEYVDQNDNVYDQYWVNNGSYGSGSFYVIPQQPETEWDDFDHGDNDWNHVEDDFSDGFWGSTQ